MMRLGDLILPPIDPAAGIDLRRAVRAGLIIITVALLGGGAWLAFAPLSGAVIAGGYVKLDLNRKSVQHQEGGIVKAVLVRDGDHVRQGQPLVLLNDVRVDAQLEMLKKEVDAERLHAARLEAERAYPAPLRLPADLAARTNDPAVHEMIERERSLHKARLQLLEEQVSLLRRQIGEVREQADALSEQVKAEERALSLQKTELGFNQDLLRQNYVQKTRVMALERAVADYESRKEEHRADWAQARQRVTELSLRIASLTSNFRQQAADELKDSTNRLLDLEERMRPSQDAAQRQTIVSPADGQVVNLQVFTPGAVVGPRELLAEIVPSEQRLIVEGRIRPEDINYVRPGVVADIRLTAYKQRTTPLVEGTVVYVSGDRLVDQRSGASYYAVNIEVPPASLGPGMPKLAAGMPAEVYIRTDERTGLDYLLAPVTNFLRRAMREPV